MHGSSSARSAPGHLAGSAALLLVITGTLSADTLIPPSSTWTFDDTGADRGTQWREPGYDDSAWPDGPAELGYGDGDEATVLSFGPDASNKYPTYYFRYTFDVPDPAAYESYTVRIVRDDGCVGYLNGVEEFRSNMPGGTITYGTYASSAVGSSGETTWFEFPLAAALVVPGANVLAVEVHQANATSSDLTFDLELIGTPAPPPVPAVTLVSPEDGTLVNSTTVSFTVSATDATGLSDATLYLGKAGKTVTFGAADCVDAQITADQPDTNSGEALSINVDGLTPHAHAVIQYPYIIGTGPGQVPPGVTVASAILQVNCTNPGNLLQVYRLIENWSEQDVTWNQRLLGTPWTSPGADGPYSNAGVATNGDCTVTGLRSIDITQFVQEWANGAPNYGVVLTDTGTDGVDFDSSESATPPLLTVTYLQSWPPIETLPLSGTSDTVTFTATVSDQEEYLWNCLVTNTSGQASWAPADFQLIVDSNAPDEPVLVAPADGATGEPLSAVLEVLASDPNGDPLDVTFYGRPAAPPGDFTIIALPDTQFYSQSYPEIYTAQTQWIADNVAARNIVFVTHEGDIVQTWDSTLEWERADASMSILDGVVPYGMGPGNHDEPTTYYNVYFPYTRYENEPWYGGHEGTLNDNNFQLFSAGGVDFIVIHLDFCPTSDIVSWADSVLKAHPDRKAIITTHGYLNTSAQRSVRLCNDTQYLWDGLAVPNDNVHFILCGHEHGEARRTDIVNGREVHQILADYQALTNGGNGWLRILKFVPAENRVDVETYSPWLDQFDTDSESRFSVDFPMSEFSSIGTVPGVASGGSASMTWEGLEPNSGYEWFAVATDPGGKMRLSPIWSFTTGSGDVSPPVLTGIQAIDITDSSATIVWTTDETADSAVDYGLDPAYGSRIIETALVTSHSVLISSLASSTTYHFQVTSADSSGNAASSADLTFTTLQANQPPVAEDQLVSTGEDTPVAVTLAATDPDGDPLTYAIVTRPQAAP